MFIWAKGFKQLAPNSTHST